MEFVTEKKLTKNNKDNKVYAQPTQEIQGKLTFFDRSLNPGQTKNAPRRKDLGSGLNLYTIKSFVFAARGVAKHKKPTNFESGAKYQARVQRRFHQRYALLRVLRVRDAPFLLQALMSHLIPFQAFAIH